MVIQARFERCDRSIWAFAWAWLLTTGLIAGGVALMALLGCNKLPGKAAAAGKTHQEKSDEPCSPADVLRTFRPYLALVNTTWEESTSPFGGWKARASLGTGIVVVSDGQRALVLTSRRLVDPHFARADSPRTRNVAFRISTPSQQTAGEQQYGRLVALYMNGTDLALLSMPAPDGKSFAVPIAGSGQLRAGDRVLAVGQPAGVGFAISDAIVNNFWQGAGAKTLEVSVASGPVDTLGPLFTQKGARLAGMLSGTPQAPTGSAVGSATPADCLFKAEHWDYLIEEGMTRQLLLNLR